MEFCAHAKPSRNHNSCPRPEGLLRPRRLDSKAILSYANFKVKIILTSSRVERLDGRLENLSAEDSAGDERLENAM